jgi:CspA family cold shock protein
MPKGTIKDVIIDRGFGFIKTQEGKDIFFHRNELEEVEFSYLKVGQEVEFELGLDKKGRSQAAKVRLIETQSPELPSSKLGGLESPKVNELPSPRPNIELGAPPKQTLLQ